MNTLNFCDNVLIHYPDKNVLATFYEYREGTYFFKNMKGLFCITEKDKQEQNIIFEVIEDY